MAFLAFLGTWNLQLTDKYTGLSHPTPTSSTNFSSFQQFAFADGAPWCIVGETCVAGRLVRVTAWSKRPRTGPLGPETVRPEPPARKLTQPPPASVIKSGDTLRT